MKIDRIRMISVHQNEDWFKWNWCFSTHPCSWHVYLLYSGLNLKRSFVIWLIFFFCFIFQISLRPAQSFILNKNQMPKLQPQIPTMIPPSAQPPRTSTPPLGQVTSATFHMGTECHLFIFKGAFNPFGCLQAPQLGLKTNPPPIQEKPQKTTKKPPPAKEELLKMTVCTAQHFVNESHSLNRFSMNLSVWLGRKLLWPLSWAAKTCTTQWMGCERWKLPNTSCLRCWVRWSCAHWRAQMRTESMSALWSTRSAWRDWSQGRTLCRFVCTQWNFHFLHRESNWDLSFPLKD